MGANDENSLMWFEPVIVPDTLPLFGGLVFPVGFKQPPGGELGSDKHVLNDHTYCCELMGTVCATGEPDISLGDECFAFHKKRLSVRDGDAKRLGVPLMITEFG